MSVFDPTIPEFRRPSAPHVESHPTEPFSPSIRPALRRSVIVTAVLSVLISVCAVLFYIFKIRTTNPNKAHDHDITPKSAEQRIDANPRGGTWHDLKFFVGLVIWGLPVYYGLRRLFKQVMDGLRMRLDLHFPSQTMSFPRRYLEPAYEVLGLVLLTCGSVGLWTACTGYIWDFQGWDICNNSSADTVHYRTSPSDRKNREVVFWRVFNAAMVHFKMTFGLVRVGSWQLMISGVEIIAMFCCAFALQELWEWVDPCTYVGLVVRNGVVPLVGMYTVIWFLDHAEDLFSIFVQESGSEVGKVHVELGLYLLLFWTVKWAPLAPFCTPLPCQETFT